MWQFIALLLSLLIEVPIVLLVVHLSEAEREPLWQRTALAAAATLITHPFAWMGSLALMGEMDATMRMLVVEAVVVVAEALFFVFVARWRWRTAILAALLANAASATAGIFLWRFL
jgi:hypothetical protein